MYRSNFFIALWVAIGISNVLRLAQSVFKDETGWNPVWYTVMVGLAAWFIAENLGRPIKPVDSKKIV